MRTGYDTHAPTLEYLCRQLEALSEGFVEAHRLEIESAAKDALPCCCKCGDIRPRTTPMMPVCGAPIRRLEAGEEPPEPTESSIGAQSPHHSLAMKVQSPYELARRKEGTALDLAIFQCAQERKRGKDCKVGVDYDDGGHVHAYVVYENGKVRNPAFEQLDPPDMCECGVSRA